MAEGLHEQERGNMEGVAHRPQAVGECTLVEGRLAGGPDCLVAEELMVVDVTCWSARPSKTVKQLQSSYLAKLLER